MSMAELVDSSGVTRFVGNLSGDVTLDGPVTIEGDATIGEASSALGFFGAALVTQPAAPVTLGDVVTALQNLGLVAT